MKLFRFAIPAVVVLFAAVPVLRADAFDAKHVPGEAKWMLHVDMDVLRGTKAWEIVQAKLDQQADFQNSITQIAQLTGMQFPQGLHDITLYGSERGDDAVVIVAHAEVDQQKMVDFLKMSPTYSGSKYAQYDIHGWQDKGKQMFGAFSANGLVIIAHDEKNVQRALDTLDGKIEAIAADAAVNGGAANHAGVVAYVAARDLVDLQAEKNPVIKQLDAGWVSVSEEGDHLNVLSNLITKTPTAAGQVRAALEGLKGALGLAASGEDADPKAKLATAALADSSVKAQDKTVSVQIKVPIALLRTVVEGKDAPATKPAGTSGL